MRLVIAVVGAVVSLGVGWFLAASGQGLNDLRIYDTANWWSPDSPYAILHRMNAVRVPYFLSHFPKDTKVVIDVGCGGGLVSEAIAQAGFNVTGFDISEGALATARSHAAANKVPVTYRQGSIYAIPLPANSVDAVIVSDVLEHLSDVPAALAEVRRVLNPNGVFVFDTIARTYWSWLSTYFVAQEVLGLVEPGAHDWRLFIQPEELEAMLTAAGFKTNRSEWAGIVAELSVADAVSARSVFKLIRAFREDKADFTSSYMGFASLGTPKPLVRSA